MKKSHWLILIILVVLIGIYFIARQKEPLERQFRFFKPDSAALTKLEFYTTEDTIIITKNKGEWKLSYPVQWDVSETQLASFFRDVLPIKTSSTPMSEDPKLQSVYKVDDASAVHVKLYGFGGLLLDHALIGNGTDTTFEYGRKAGSNKIYQFRNNVTSLVRPDIFIWRSPNITNLKRNQIDRIEVVYTANAYTLTLLPDSIRYTDKRESFNIPQYNKAQYRILNGLENLMTWQFIDKDTEQYAKAFEHPDCTIRVFLKDKRTKTFTLIRRNIPKDYVNNGAPDKDVLVLMKIDDQMTPLYQMTGDFINRFTRASIHFKTEFD
jgi:hypothetical protein